jgi:hypothetical protein
VVDNQNWNIAGVAKLSKSKKSINLYVDGRFLLLNVEDLFELVAGKYVSMDVFEVIVEKKVGSCQIKEEVSLRG